MILDRCHHEISQDFFYSFFCPFVSRVVNQLIKMILQVNMYKISSFLKIMNSSLKIADALQTRDMLFREIIKTSCKHSFPFIRLILVLFQQNFLHWGGLSVIFLFFIAFHCLFFSFDDWFIFARLVI